jgi:hypothetical protein
MTAGDITDRQKFKASVLSRKKKQPSTPENAGDWSIHFPSVPFAYITLHHWKQSRRRHYGAKINRFIEHNMEGFEKNG